MSELLLCPFCGGEAETLTAESMHGGYLFGIMCSDCRSRGDVYDTEAEAIAAWNSRAERITDDEWEIYQHSVPATDENMAKFGWVRERTCKQEERGWGTEGDHARVWLTCGHDCMVPTVQDLPNYCPNCGCKVVGE